MHVNILTHKAIGTGNMTTFVWGPGPGRSRRHTVMTDAGLHQVMDNLNIAHMNSYAVDSLVNPIYTCATNNRTNAYCIDGLLSELPYVSNH